MYLGNLWKFLTFSMCSNQLTHKMPPNDSQLKVKLTIHDI